jgi:hypothetical protein
MSEDESKLSEQEGKLLARLDERIKAIAEDISDLKTNYVTKAEFTPIRAIVFGGVALVLTSFMGALIVMAGMNHP